MQGLKARKNTFEKTFFSLVFSKIRTLRILKFKP